MGLAGLDHVQLAAPRDSEDAARVFFGALLGLPELEKPEPLRARGGVWFALPDGRQLHIGVADPFTPAAKAHPAFAVEAYDAFRQRLLDAGVAVRDDEEIPGVRRFYADDPWGNRLEFVERV